MKRQRKDVSLLIRYIQQHGPEQQQLQLREADARVPRAARQGMQF